MSQMEERVVFEANRSLCNVAWEEKVWVVEGGGCREATGTLLTPAQRETWSIGESIKGKSTLFAHYLA